MNTSRSPWLVLALAAMAVTLSPFARAFELDRTLVTTEPLRILTCQWTHWSGDHLFWDVVVFVAIGIGCERRSRRRTALTIAAAALFVPLAVLFACPTIETFRGLSGVDSALFGLLLATTFRETAGRVRTVVAFVGVAFVVKTAFEAATGQAVFVDAASFAVVPMAHVAGFAIGIANGAARERNR